LQLRLGDNTMGVGSATCREPHPADGSEPELLQLLHSLTLAVFNELGPSRYSKLLDAIAENEFFHDLTMID